MKKITKIIIILVAVIAIATTWMIIDVKIRNNKFVDEANGKFMNNEDGVINSLGTGYLKFQEVYWNSCTKPYCLTCIDGCLARKINGVDTETFQILNDNYAVDKNTAYYRYEAINDSDSESFRVVDISSAEDVNYEYKDGQIIENRR